MLSDQSVFHSYISYAIRRVCDVILLWFGKAKDISKLKA